MGPGSVTDLLLAWRAGDETALARLTPLVHQELRRMARRCMRGERAGHSLQATALVHEAYLRLVDVQHVNWHNRAHFLAMAARLMRRVLVDAARARRSQKRGGGVLPPSLSDARRHPEKGEGVVGVDEGPHALAGGGEARATPEP